MIVIAYETQSIQIDHSPPQQKQTIAAKVPIILLILSFAYLSISLDISGFFKAAATYVVGLARGNGHRLLVYVYLLCSALTYFTSNDIVILSMTPLLMHVGDCSSIRDAVPLLTTQYIAANTAAMGLLVGSPTNIILGAFALGVCMWSRTHKHSRRMLVHLGRF